MSKDVVEDKPSVLEGIINSVMGNDDHNKTVFDDEIQRLSVAATGDTLGVSNRVAIDEAERRMGKDLEQAMGETLARLRTAPEGSEDHKHYQELQKSFAENEPGVTDFFRDGGDTKAFFTKLATHMDASTIMKTAFSVAGIDKDATGTFMQRLRDNEGVQNRLETLVASTIKNGMSGDETPNIEGLTNRLRENAPVLQAIAANPNSFFRIAQSGAAETVINKVLEHNNKGGSFDNAGVAGIVSDFSLQEKAGMLMDMGGASRDSIAGFQEKLATALEKHPQLEAVINTAITNSITTPGDGSASSGNPFVALDRTSQLFADYANSEGAETLLNSDQLMTGIIERANTTTEPLTLATLKNIAIEDTVHHEAGMAAAIAGSSAPVAALALGGPMMKSLIDRAKNLGDNNSADMMGPNGILGHFMGMYSGEWTSGNGLLGGIMGNMPGGPGSWMGQAVGFVGNRFGADLTQTQQVIAGLNSAYIFDGTGRDGLQAVNYTKIGENLEKGIYDANGDVRKPENAAKPLMQHMATEVTAMLKKTLELSDGST